MAIKTEIDTRTESKGVGNLGWFMSKTLTATSPPREGEPAGTGLKPTAAPSMLALGEVCM